MNRINYISECSVFFRWKWNLYQNTVCSSLTVTESCFEGKVQPPLCKFEIMQLCANILMFSNVMCCTSNALSPVFRRMPVCYPLLTMWSVCPVVLALASAALSSAESDTYRPKHDSNLEICILMLSVWRAAANTRARLWGCQRVCPSLYVHVCFSFFSWVHERAPAWVIPMCKACVVLTSLLSDKRLFETKRKDQLNALKNLVELNDINQQYKIIDIMLKGLFKVGCVYVSSHFISSHRLWAGEKSSIKTQRATGISKSSTFLYFTQIEGQEGSHTNRESKA